MESKFTLFQSKHGSSYGDSVRAEEARETATAIADGERGAILFVGGGLAAVVALVSSCESVRV